LKNKSALVAENNMAETETVYVGQSGDVPFPTAIRERAGISAGSAVTLEAREGMVIVRTSELDPEIYTPERKAEFLLSNAVDAEDYASACNEVRKLGLDPSKISHLRPPGV
jgi:bifunctional DNA-binding transcriptional regulator/antitoxin component of YhaV-PrlF toxin-antitoxin module